METTAIAEINPGGDPIVVNPPEGAEPVEPLRPVEGGRADGRP